LLFKVFFKRLEVKIFPPLPIGINLVLGHISMDEGDLRPLRHFLEQNLKMQIGRALREFRRSARLE